MLLFIASDAFDSFHPTTRTTTSNEMKAWAWCLDDGNSASKPGIQLRTKQNIILYGKQNYLLVYD